MRLSLQQTGLLALCFLTAAFGFGVADANAQGSDSKPMVKPAMEKGSMTKEMADAPAEPQAFAFVELFTSEGCSSCPSADRNLERIVSSAKSNGLNVYALSFHVDYWNKLGWTDPYSSEAFTNRQRQYAQQFESSRIYTPQMVINGAVEFVGSNQKASDQAIAAALEIRPTETVNLAAKIVEGKVVVDWKLSAEQPAGTLHVGLVQNEGAQEVTRGENARRNLTHANIIRDLQSERLPSQTGQLMFTPPEGFAAGDYHIVGFVQSTGGIVAASKSTIASSN